MEVSASQNARVLEGILQNGFLYSGEYQADIRCVCCLGETGKELACY